MSATKSVPRTRVFDAATAEKLYTLHNHALEHGLRVCIDFDGLRVPKAFWIVQLFDQAEKDVLSGRGRTLAESIAELHERWLARGVTSA